ncbi:hypothetical protein TD95_003098 [Thielaviopsis punctulata]|uniref:Cenp-O kinetochore centromere component n=1 Tax=Thielaviopsis punctulata TaxID=72032 RepID=A0A0F4ZH06_9PEZI|nr:hypothetical protein TD95_003098 [Thielaviopsis punctulata]
MAETAEDPVAKALDDEIASLQSQVPPVASLKHQLRIQATNILTAESIHRALLSRSSSSSIPTNLSPVSTLLADRLAAQHAYDQQSLYRLCASITAFRVHDPDPYAVDSGKVFGLRFEVMVSARFQRPYYVLLNRPWPHRRAWRVHRHTVPAAIPLAGLAATHLPGVPGGTERADAAEDEQGPEPVQDIVGFVRALRRELWRFHNRVAAIADVRRAAGVVKNQALASLEDELATDGERAKGVLELGASDAQAKQIAITWVDGRTGRVVVDDDGVVKQATVYREGEADLVTAQRLKGVGEMVRLEDLVGRLEEAFEEPERESLQL